MDIKKIAEDFVEHGVQPSKEQLMDMTQKELYDFTFLVESLKKKAEAEAERKKNYAYIESCIKSNQSVVVIVMKEDGGSEEWIVTPHALQRFVERGPQNCKDILKLLSKDLSKMTSAKASKRHRTASLLNHHFEGAKYYFGRLTGLLYVVVDKNVVKTCHRNESKRWKRKKA